MACLGLLFTFSAQETLATAGLSVQGAALFPYQIIGALYVGFALINWMGKSNLIGGVFGRPIALGNLAHFFIAGMAIAKTAAGGASALWLAAIVYLAFASAFAFVTFGRFNRQACS